MRKIYSNPVKSFVHHEETGALMQLSNYLYNYIPFDHDEIIFCCIGTDRSTGDSLGPLTGSILSSFSSFPFEIIGTLENPLHAINLASTIEEINQKPSTPFIIAIDACLGNELNLGHIIVHEGPLLPGKAVKKELPPIGDISIKGIVNIGGFMEMLVLQNTRLNVTYSMSNKIAKAIYFAWQRHLLEKKKQSENLIEHDQPKPQLGYTNLS